MIFSLASVRRSALLSSVFLLTTAFLTAAAPAPGIYRGFQQTGGELFMVELAPQEPTFLGADGLDWTTWGTDRFEGSGTVSPKKPWMKVQVHKLDPSSKFVAQNWEAGLKNYVVREAREDLSFSSVGGMKHEEVAKTQDDLYLVSIYSASSGPRQKPGDGSVLQKVDWNAEERLFMGLDETTMNAADADTDDAALRSQQTLRKAKVLEAFLAARPWNVVSLHHLLLRPEPPMGNEFVGNIAQIAEMLEKLGEQNPAAIGGVTVLHGGRASERMTSLVGTPHDWDTVGIKYPKGTFPATVWAGSEKTWVVYVKMAKWGTMMMIMDWEEFAEEKFWTKAGVQAFEEGLLFPLGGEEELDWAEVAKQLAPVVPARREGMCVIV